MSKAIEVSISVHKDVLACCRASLVKFAAGDYYRGNGEPGDRIKCACGNWLRYEHRGWRTEEPSDDEGLEPIETSPLTEREPDL